MSIERISKAVPASSPLFEYDPGDEVRIFEYGFVGDRGADRRNDPFTDTGQNSILTGTSDQLFDVCTHRNAGFCDQLDSVFGHGCNRGRIDNFRVDRHLYGFGYVSAGQIDRGGHPEIECDVGFLSRDEGCYDVGHITSGQEVGFQIVGRELQSGFRAGDHLG